ncbi:hypothetical protein CUZ95_2292 [Enterococcus lactis]|nr:hypothetical protein [Enterococcus lactis]
MLFLAMMTRMFKPAIKRSNEQAPKQLLVKKKTVKQQAARQRTKKHKIVHPNNYQMLKQTIGN